MKAGVDLTGRLRRPDGWSWRPKTRALFHCPALLFSIVATNRARRSRAVRTDAGNRMRFGSSQTWSVQDRDPASTPDLHASFM